VVQVLGELDLRKALILLVPEVGIEPTRAFGSLDFESVQGLSEKPMITGNYPVFIGFFLCPDARNMRVFQYLQDTIGTVWAQSAGYSIRISRLNRDWTLIVPVYQ